MSMGVHVCVRVFVCGGWVAEWVGVGVSVSVYN